MQVSVSCGEMRSNNESAFSHGLISPSYMFRPDRPVGKVATVVYGQGPLFLCEAVDIPGIRVRVAKDNQVLDLGRLASAWLGRSKREARSNHSDSCDGKQVHQHGIPVESGGQVRGWDGRKKEAGVEKEEIPIPIFILDLTWVSDSHEEI